MMGVKSWNVRAVFPAGSTSVNREEADPQNKKHIPRKAGDMLFLFGVRVQRAESQFSRVPEAYSPMKMSSTSRGGWISEPSC